MEEPNRDFINILKDYSGIEEQSKELLVHIKSNPYIVRIPCDATLENVASYRNLISKKIKYRLAHAPDQKGTHINFTGIHVDEDRQLFPDLLFKDACWNSMQRIVIQMT